MQVPQGPMPETCAKALGPQGNAVWVQRLLSLLLLGSQLISQGNALPSELPGQCVCLVFGLAARILHQHCPVACSRPANARDSCDALRNW